MYVRVSNVISSNQGEKGRKTRSLTKKRNPEENLGIMYHKSSKSKYHGEKEAEKVPIDFKNLAR